MIIKTSCHQCIFNKIEACKLQYPNIYEDDKYSIDGFCRDKRSEEDFSEKDALESIKDTKNLVTAVIICDNNLDDLHRTFKMLQKEEDSLFSSTLVIMKNVDVHSNVKKVVNEMIEMFPNRKWSVEKILDSQDFPIEYSLVDWCARFVKTEWFVTIFAGDTFSRPLSNEIRTKIKENQFITSLYFDPNDPVRMFIHRRAFAEIRGNQGKTFLKKMKESLNFDEVCLPIETKIHLASKNKPKDLYNLE